MNVVPKVLRDLRNAVLNMIARGVVNLVSDTPALQELQVSLLAGEVRGRVERFQDYGFTSVPLPPDADGAPEAVCAAIGGARAHMVALAVDDRRHRLRGLMAGEVALYSDEGDSIALKRNGRIELAAGQTLEVTAGNCTLTIGPTGISMEATGEIDLTCDSFRVTTSGGVLEA